MVREARFNAGIASTVGVWQVTNINSINRLSHELAAVMAPGLYITLHFIDKHCAV